MRRECIPDLRGAASELLSANVDNAASLRSQILGVAEIIQSALDPCTYLRCACEEKARGQGYNLVATARENVRAIAKVLANVRGTGTLDRLRTGVAELCCTLLQLGVTHNATIHGYTLPLRQRARELFGGSIPENTLGPIS